MFKLASILLTLGMAAQANAACPKNTIKSDQRVTQKTACILKGTIVEDVYLTNTNDYLLEGAVFIGGDNGKAGDQVVLNPAVLTIDPGTSIFALNPKKDTSLPEEQRRDRKDFLVISRGSKIIAEGTERSPIVFTSKSKDPKRGDWGGLFINGQAPSNKCADAENCVLEGEAGTGYYGGNNKLDNSGSIKYVRVEYGGDKITEEKEFNGITFNAAGSGTEVEYIQVHKNNDDGVEFFGGTVNVNYVVVTGAGDDSIDWTDGYRGAIQFALVIQDKDDADRGIEADNDKKNPNRGPRSDVFISNMTLIGSGAGKEGLKLRRGTTAMIINSVIYGFNICSETSEAHSSLVIKNNTFTCKDLGSAGQFEDNMFVGTEELDLNVYMPGEDSVLLGEGFIDPRLIKNSKNKEKYKNIDLSIDYIGAFDEDEDWTESWTVGL